MPDTEPAAPRGFVSLRAFLWIAVALVGGMGLIAWLGNSPHDRPANVAASFGGAFELTAPDGALVSDKTLAGKPYAIFFGFTRCPDVCPTNLARMARLRQKLGTDGMKFAIVFVSVDPEHDTREGIGKYVELFNTPIIGLTGTPEQLARIQKGFAVYVKRVPLDAAKPEGDYTIDHTAATYLMTADGKLQSIIAHEEADEMALAKLKRLIG